MARNRVIGAGGAMPWHLPDELKRFKAITLGHPIVMGRRTFEAIGRILPGRLNVVVTRNAGYRAPGAQVVHDLDEAIGACRGAGELFIIGGAELYRAALPHAHRLYLTLVEADVPGDTWMPQFDLAEWRETGCEHFPADSRHRHAYTCSVLERVTA